MAPSLENGPDSAAIVSDRDAHQDDAPWLKSGTPETGSARTLVEPEHQLDVEKIPSAIAIGSSQPQCTTNERKRKPWYRRLTPRRWRAIPSTPNKRTVSPEHAAGWWSQATFRWMTPIMSVGYRRPLELNDIWLVNPDRAIDPLAHRFDRAFARRRAQGDPNPLPWALHETFRSEFWLGGASLFVAVVCQVMSPLALRYLISFAANAYAARRVGEDGPPIGRGFGLVAGIMGMQVLQSLGTSQFTYRASIVGGQARGVLITAIFEKSMKISGRAKAGGGSTVDLVSSTPAESHKRDSHKRRLFGRKAKNGGPGLTSASDATKAKKGANDDSGWPDGRVLNMMSTDTHRVDQACGMFHLVWGAPLTILMTLVILLVNLSYSALAGFSLLILGIPALTFAIKSLLTRRVSINKVTDSRVSLTQEVLKSVRFVKLYGWQNAFLAQLKDLRKREIRLIRTLLTTRNGIHVLSVSLPLFASMLAFIVYSLTGHTLHPAPVFSSLALFNSLRIPFNVLPVVVNLVTDAWAALGRIQSYLMAEEQQDEVIWEMGAAQAVVVEHADFVWERIATHEADSGDGPAKKDAKDAEKEGVSQHRLSEGNDEPAERFALHDINLSVDRNELVAVIGTVGSGKSSLLAALAGDMRKTSGQVRMGATRAFCPQYAWIQNTTVQENILFGQEMDRKRYERVIWACALRADLDMLPAGDQTMIGERGITLSGGQKQRLNIARAIYSNRDIVLMDDPLSAVDAHVGRHIFDEAICGMLANKCRILATHQLHILSRCDRVVWLEEGRTRAIDTFPNLMKDPAFQSMMASTAQEEREEEQTRALANPAPGKTNDVPAAAVVQKDATLMQDEERAVNGVAWEVYAAYIRSSGTIFNGFIPMFLVVLAQGSNIVTNLWLSYWTANRFEFAKGPYIAIYVGLAVFQVVLMFSFNVTVSTLCVKASRIMLDRAMARVLRAPTSFFDTTPLGRITNRFARDVDVMDNTLADALRMYLFTLAVIMSVFALLIAFFHYAAIALGPLSVLFLFAAAYYRSSAREMKRHEAVLRSVMFARFTESLSGTSSIRAYGLQELCTRILRGSIDDMNSAYYLTISNQRWLSTRLDVIANLVVLTTGILTVTLRFTVLPSTSGLVFAYVLSIVQMIQLLVRQLAEVENAMNATERVHHYGTQIEEEEEEAKSRRVTTVDAHWPAQGEIHFNDVQMRYRPGLPLVLRGFDLQVAGGERIGIVGRTGAGKSSIMSALFRLNELSGGRIVIDGVDIATLPLHDLRSRLAIIPQDPTLFRGTIRSNLDPFDKHTDLELWGALRQAGLTGDGDGDSDVVVNPQDCNEKNHHPRKAVSSRIHLDTTVEEEGLNFSLGQRQLMALARALVRNSQIIVCDEATSSVDLATDQKIQQTILTAFRGKTLLCIAHRLRTILRYDRICVLDQGRIVELDTPLALYLRQESRFRAMCDRSRISRGDFTS